MGTVYPMDAGRNLLIYESGNTLYIRTTIGEGLTRPVTLCTDFTGGLSDTIYNGTVYYCYINTGHDIVVRSITDLQELYKIESREPSDCLNPHLVNFRNMLLLFYVIRNPINDAYCLKALFPFETQRHIILPEQCYDSCPDVRIVYSENDMLVYAYDGASRQILHFDREGNYAVLERADIGKGRIAELEQALSESAGKAAELEQALSESVGKAAELEQTLSESAGRTAELEQALSESAGRTAELEQALSESQGRAAELEQALSESAGRTAELEQALSESQGRAAELEQALSESKGRIAELKQTLTACREQLGERNSMIENIKAQYEELMDTALKYKEEAAKWHDIACRKDIRPIPGEHLITDNW